MTLLVGILANDGAVIASDRAVTFSGAQSLTIADSTRKVTIIDGQVIVVGTGQVGLGQRFTAQVSAAWKSKKLGVEGVEAGRVLANIGLNDFATTLAPKGQYGALVAFANSKGPHVIEFAVSDFQPQLFTPEIPYVSMGSGQTLADPYLALLRRCVWTDGPPSVAEATFAAYWVMHQAIVAAPGFIAAPIDIAVLRKTNKGYEAALLGETDIDEHKNRAQAANEQLADALRGVSKEAPPPPPPPPEGTPPPSPLL